MIIMKTEIFQAQGLLKYRRAFFGETLPEALVGCIGKLRGSLVLEKNYEKYFFIMEKLYFENFPTTFF